MKSERELKRAFASFAGQRGGWAVVVCDANGKPTIVMGGCGPVPDNLLIVVGPS